MTEPIKTVQKKLVELSKTSEKVVSKGSWYVDIDEWDGARVLIQDAGPGDVIVCQDLHQGRDDGESDAHYIASMNPVVGRTVVDTLRTILAEAEPGGWVESTAVRKFKEAGLL
jgi:hypothetical protein